MLKDYPYLYETHLHTSEASACAVSSGWEMARACKEAGYTGIFVTNHNWHGNHCIDDTLPWEQWVKRYARGYEVAKAWGDANGLDVFFGYEAGYRGTEFLVYGIDMAWLIEHPEIREATVEEQYRWIHEAGGMVIHAHPFREEPYIPEIRLFPRYVDGVEGVNATHSHPESGSHNNPLFDERAIAYSQKYQLPLTAGSDVHSTHILGGGVAFKRRLRDARDYCQAIRSGEDYALTNGVDWYDREGRKIEMEEGL